MIQSRAQQFQSSSGPKCHQSDYESVLHKVLAIFPGQKRLEPEQKTKKRNSHIGKILGSLTRLMNSPCRGRVCLCGHLSHGGTDELRFSF